MTDDWFYAPAKTLPGALQRGCGSAHPVPPDLVLDCLRRDYRWDRQVDERTVYLARLVLDVGLPIDPLVEQIWHGNNFAQSVDVLAALARTGLTAAADALRNYVCEGDRWLDVLQSVAEAWPREWWDDLTPIVAGRVAEVAPEEVLTYQEPWLSWTGRDPRIDALLERAQPSFAWSCPSLSYRDAPVSTLLGLLAAPSTETHSAVLHEFARHRDPEPRLLDVTDQLAARPDVLRTGLFHALDKLGPQTLRHARQWASIPSHPLQWRAVRTLTVHGEPADVPALLAALERLDSDKDDWCGYDILADGFARLGVTEVVPRFCSLWRCTPHSHERAAYAEALLTLDPDAMRERLPEALFDCESDVRLLAVRHAPVSDEVRQGLRRLRDFSIETEDVREAAAARLTPG